MGGEGIASFGFRVAGCWLLVVDCWLRIPDFNSLILNLKSQIPNPKFAPNLKIISPLHFSWKGQTLWLSERRCIYWEEKKILILSDPHFGKPGHFRKEGIPIPQKIVQADLHALFEVIQFFKPGKILITGDLFHSTHNKEIDLFFQWREYVSQIPVILVKGNHDILDDAIYISAKIELHEEKWCVENFCFTHEAATFGSGHYVFSGHIHPAVRIAGLGKQSLRLPCFYFGKNYAILPAFGKFTGSATIRPANGDKVFAITKNEIISLH